MDSADQPDDLARRLARLAELETQFQAALEQEKLAALAEFAAGAGHEINNPAAVISGRAQLLLRDERDPERRRELAAIHAQATRIHEMIADAMLFARPPQPQRAACNAAAIVQQVAAELFARAAELDATLTAPAASEPGDLALWADARQIAVALRALCDNALDWLPRGGRVELEVRRDGAWVELVVRDDGPGIPPEIPPRIFDPFFSGRSAGRGLGLGLSKCWRIVTLHGGSVDVATPASGRGAEFRIRLPAGSEPPA